MSSASRIFLLVPSLGGGGAERVWLNYLRELDRTRFEPELVVCVREGELVDDVPEGAVVHELGAAGPWAVPRRVHALRRLCRERRPAAVVSAIWYADFLQLAARGLGAPWASVVTIHALYSAFEGQRHVPLKRMLMKQLYPRAAAAWCVSEVVAEDFRRAWSRHGRPRVEVQLNPIDLDAIACKAATVSAPERRATHRIVAVGRLHRDKGFDLLLEALPALAQEVDVELYVVGTGPEEAALRDQARRLGVDSRVTFTGFLANPYPIVASADVLVAPSRSEAASLVTIEALSLGVPIVASRVGGLPEIADHGACGRIVPPRDVAALADATLELLRDESLRARIGEAGRVHAERYRPEVAMRQFEDRLAALIGGG